MNVERFVVGGIETNCYVCFSDDKEAVVIDPGGDGQKILDFIKDNDLKLKFIINTHGHGDHIGANSKIKAATGALILIHENDKDFLADPVKNLSRCFEMQITSPEADRLLYDKDIIEFGQEKLKVIETPGHTMGCISLLGEKEIFTGDTLFCEGIGRTDLPHSSNKSMQESLSILKKQDPNLIVYPGHGPQTSIDRELKTNPFL